MHRRALAALTIALIAVAAFVLGARVPAAAEEEVVRIVRATFDPPKAPRGGRAAVKIEFTIDAGWHMYPQSDENQRPDFEWDAAKGLTPGKVEDETKPNSESFGAPAFEHALTVVQWFDVAADAPIGTVQLTGKARWQHCSDTMCVPQKDKPVAAKLEIVEGDGSGVPANPPANGGHVAATPPGAPPAAPQQNPQPPKAAPAPPAGWSPGPPPGAKSYLDADDLPDAEKSLWETILAGIAWGGITVLTPCVFPLLPVTVSFFSKQKGPALPRALVYALGIIFTITVIGLVFSSSLDVFARGWAFNLAVAILFFALSMSLFGAFDLRLPGFMVDWSTNKAGAGGFMGPFFMAVTLALTSFSCSVPFLALMFQGFKSGGQGTAIAGLLAYSVTLAAPFFLCALFPAAINALPKAGNWMNAIKVVMGFVEFALAWKFLRTVNLDWFPRSVVLAIWAACTLGAALYLLGYIVLPHDTKTESIGSGRLVVALGFLAATVYLLPGVAGKPIANSLEAFLQTRPEEIDGGSGEHIPWKKNDWNATRLAAESADKPILLDFTGVG